MNLSKEESTKQNTTRTESITKEPTGNHEGGCTEVATFVVNVYRERISIIYNDE